MNNAELISMVRSIAKHGADWRINEVLNRASDALEAAEQRIAELEAQMPKEGEWIDNGNGTYSCNRCGSWIPNEQHFYARYCLYCGAKMKGVNDGET